MDTLVDKVAGETEFSGVVRVDRGGETFAKAYGLADRRHGIAHDGRLPARPGQRLEGLHRARRDEPGRPRRARPSTPGPATSSAPTCRWSPTTSPSPTCSPTPPASATTSTRTVEGDIGDYAMPLSAHVYATTEAFMPWLDGHPTKFKAGERFSYCNGGYMVLALIAERVSGTGFHDLVRQRVFAPAGLADTDYLRSDDLPGRAAVGYVEVAGQTRTNVFHLPVLGNGDGGAYSTVADIHRFWTALFAGRILPAETVREMTRPHTEEYGMGFWVDDDGVGWSAPTPASRSQPRTTRPPATRSTVIANTTDGRLAGRQGSARLVWARGTAAGGTAAEREGRPRHRRTGRRHRPRGVVPPARRRRPAVARRPGRPHPPRVRVRPPDRRRRRPDRPAQGPAAGAAPRRWRA